MLSFMSKFFSLASSYLSIEALNTLAKSFPRTLFRAKKHLDQLKDRFVRYVSCPLCHRLYLSSDCWKKNASGVKESCTCSFIRYPMHMQARMRAPCGQKLLKTRRSSRGSDFLTPYQTYCYKSIVDSLTELLNRPNVAELCEFWRNRNFDSDVLRMYLMVKCGNIFDLITKETHF